MGVSYILSGQRGRDENSGANAETTSRMIRGDKLPVYIMILISLWAFQSRVSEVAGKALPFTAAATPPSSSKRLAPAAGPEVAEGHGPTPIGQAPKHSAPPELSDPPTQSGAPQQSDPPTPEEPAGQVVQFQQVLSSLRLNNYTTGAQYISDYLFLLPLETTLFVPTNEAFHGVKNGDDASLSTGPVLAYHAILQQLSYQQIALLPVGTRFATLIADNNTIEITSVAPDYLRVDDVRVVQRDICSSSTLALQISCHGVDGILNMTEWGRTSPAPIAPPGALIDPPTFSPAPAPKASSRAIESPARACASTPAPA